MKVRTYSILCINPGSTSTKAGVFADEREIHVTEATHSACELTQYVRLVDQCEFRKETILGTLKQAGITPADLDCIVGRGGLLRPMESGTYEVNQRMLEELREEKHGAHASNLGAILAWLIAQVIGKPCFIVDPIAVDELQEIARITGVPEIRRSSIFHGLNHKAVARLAAQEIGRPYEEVNLIVVHLGGGITVGVHKQGRVVDVNDGLRGEGPFAPTRSGALPVWDVIKLTLSGRYTEAELREKVMNKEGIRAHLGTSDFQVVKQRVENGDRHAELVYRAMAYQIAREIGACAAVLEGRADAVVISGGMARDRVLVDPISQRVRFISKILVYPGEK